MSTHGVVDDAVVVHVVVTGIAESVTISVFLAAVGNTNTVVLRATNRTIDTVRS